MTVFDAAKILEVQPSTVYDLCSKKLLAHHRIGTGRGKIVIDPSDIAEFKRSRRVEASGPDDFARPVSRGLGLSVKDLILEREARKKSRA